VLSCLVQLWLLFGAKKKLLNYTNIQEKLEGYRQNREVDAKIAQELVDAGYTRSFEQCRDKMKKLRGELKKKKMKERRWDKAST